MGTAPRARSLSLAVQALGLRSLFPDSQIRLKRRRLIWVGELSPTELSVSYRVRITYELGRYPRVYVIDPPITDTPNFVPHVYRSGDLCIHDLDDWNASMLLVDTIVAWTVEWLFFWELFLATDNWYGDVPRDRTAGRVPTICRLAMIELADRIAVVPPSDGRNRDR